MTNQIAQQQLTNPSGKLRAVTPGDDADLPDGLTRALFVGAAGTVQVVDATGMQTAIVSGSSQYHPIRVKRVLATGTDATGIVAVY